MVASFSYCSQCLGPSVIAFLSQYALIYPFARFIHFSGSWIKLVNNNMLYYEYYLIGKLYTYLSKKRHFILYWKILPWANLLSDLNDQFHSINISFLIVLLCGGHHQNCSNKSIISWWQMIEGIAVDHHMRGSFMWEITLIQW